MISSTLPENVNIGICILDADKKVQFLNSKAYQILGYSLKEMIEEDNCSWLYNIPIDREDEAIETSFYNKKGVQVPVRLTASPLHLNDKKATIILIEDLTPQLKIKRDMENLKKIALVDTLTELPNRKHIELSLKHLLKRNQNGEEVFGVIFLDIDDFKFINDNYGHVMGDYILKKIAFTLEEGKRSNDLVSRWGGEEFLIVIRDVQESEILNIAERFRTLIEKSELYRNGVVLKRTASFGITVVKEGDTVETLVERADKAMYRSKITGKNRITRI